MKIVVRSFVYLVYISIMVFVTAHIATRWSSWAFTFVMVVAGALYLRAAMNWEEKKINEHYAAKEREKVHSNE